MTVVSVLENIRVFQHFRARKLHKEVPRHIVSQVSHHDCSLTSFLHRRTLYFAEVNIPVDIHLAISIVYTLGCRQNFTIPLIKVEQSL